MRQRDQVEASVQDLELPGHQARDSGSSKPGPGSDIESAKLRLRHLARERLQQLTVQTSDIEDGGARAREHPAQHDGLQECRRDRCRIVVNDELMRRLVSIGVRGAAIKSIDSREPVRIRHSKDQTARCTAAQANRLRITFSEIEVTK